MSNKKHKTAEEMIAEAQPKLKALGKFLRKNPIQIPTQYCKNCKTEEPVDLNFSSAEKSQLECMTCGLKTYSDKEGVKYYLNNEEIKL